MSTIDGRKIDPTVFEDWSRPLERARAELYCAFLVIMPGKQTRTTAIATIALVGIWGMMVLGVEFSHPHISFQYDAGAAILISTTALVFAILGRMWGVEVDGFINGLGVSSDERDDED